MVKSYYPTPTNDPMLKGKEWRYTVHKTNPKSGEQIVFDIYEGSDRHFSYVALCIVDDEVIAEAGPTPKDAMALAIEIINCPEDDGEVDICPPDDIY